MSGSQHADGAGPSHRAVEIGVALLVALFGFITIAGSLRVGIGWGAEGPKSGFFPFYIGLLIVLSSVVNLAHAWRENSGRLFAGWDQLRQVLSVLIPTAIYVVAVPFVGIYLASAVLITVFMKWLGGYSWLLTIAIAIGVPFVLFLVFETWFLVPLPKGPIEDWLGL